MNKADEIVKHRQGMIQQTKPQPVKQIQKEISQKKVQ